MDISKKHWLAHPSKKQTITIFFVWLLGFISVLLATTDNFTIDPFTQRNALLILTLFMSSVAYSRIVMNYLKNNKQKSEVFNKVVLKIIDVITDNVFMMTLGVLSSFLIRSGMRVSGKLVLGILFLTIVLRLFKFWDKKSAKRNNSI